MPDSVHRRGFPDSMMPEDPRARRRFAIAAWAGVAAILGWTIFRVLRMSTVFESGDFEHFYKAAEAMLAGADPYLVHKGGYIYPPLFAWTIQPLVWLGEQWGAIAWGAINFVLIVLSLRLWLSIVERRFGSPTEPLTRASTCLLALLLSLEPTRWVMENGQSDAITLLAFSLAVWWVDRSALAARLGAGAILSIAVQIKHQAILPVIYLAVRGRWWSVLGFVVALPVVAALPMLTLGFDRWLDAMTRAYSYVVTVGSGAAPPEGKTLHDITWDRSISIPSALARAFETESGVPMPAVVLAVGLVAALTLGASWLMYARYRLPLFRGRGGLQLDERSRGLMVLEWCGLIVALVIFSPQTEMRHTFLLLGPHVLVASLLLVPRAGVPRVPLLIVVVLAQLSSRLPPGEPGFEAALAWWRGVGGASWCVLAMWLGLLWAALAAVARMQGPAQDAATER